MGRGSCPWLQQVLVRKASVKPPVRVIWSGRGAGPEEVMGTELPGVSTYGLSLWCVKKAD